jgi:hypothetical protein
MDFKQASVYWIRIKDHTSVLDQGYIGVSKNADKRFREHLREIHKGSHTNPHLVNAVQKYGEENLILEILLSGEENFCYTFEADLRPMRKIGWNIAPGGHRGPGRKKGLQPDRRDGPRPVSEKRRKLLEECERYMNMTSEERVSFNEEYWRNRND